jgi:HPt (histidine-containing phosphotransfer) domain-containing protein
MSGVIPADIESIDGLDTAAGASHTGGPGGYMEVLRMVCDQIDADADALTTSAASGDLAAYALKAHSLRGIFAVIGHQALSDWAARLEAAAKASSTPSPPSPTAFIAAMKALRDTLQGWV